MQEGPAGSNHRADFHLLRRDEILGTMYHTTNMPKLLCTNNVNIPEGRLLARGDSYFLSMCKEVMSQLSPLESSLRRFDQSRISLQALQIPDVVYDTSDEEM